MTKSDGNSGPGVTVCDRNIPRSSLLLGWAGVLPFAVLAVMLALDLPSPIPQTRMMLIGYGAVILSFMGGVHWGLAMKSEHAGRDYWVALHYALSVVPALVAWAALATPPSHAMLVLAGAFLILVIIDVTWTSGRKAPAWYGKLRLQLTFVVLLCLCLAWAAS